MNKTDLLHFDKTKMNNIKKIIISIVFLILILTVFIFWLNLLTIKVFLENKITSEAITDAKRDFNIDELKYYELMLIDDHETVQNSNSTGENYSVNGYNLEKYFYPFSHHWVEMFFVISNKEIATWYVESYNTTTSSLLGKIRE